jgi:hypothetical protein
VGSWSTQDREGTAPKDPNHQLTWGLKDPAAPSGLAGRHLAAVFGKVPLTYFSIQFSSGGDDGRLVIRSYAESDLEGLVRLWEAPDSSQERGTRWRSTRQWRFCEALNRPAL